MPKNTFGAEVKCNITINVCLVPKPALKNYRLVTTVYNACFFQCSGMKSKFQTYTSHELHSGKKNCHKKNTENNSQFSGRKCLSNYWPKPAIDNAHVGGVVHAAVRIKNGIHDLHMWLVPLANVTSWPWSCWWRLIPMGNRCVLYVFMTLSGPVDNAKTTY